MNASTLIGLSVLTGLLLCNLVITLALVRKVNAISDSAQNFIQTKLQTGDQIPEFSAMSLNGGSVKREKYLQGERITSFLFVTTTCSYCRELIPSYQKLSSLKEDSGFDFVLVSGTEEEPTRKMVEEFGVEFDVLVAPRQANSMFEDFKVTGVPSYCTFDASGLVLNAGYPTLEKDDWKKFIEEWKSEPT